MELNRGQRIIADCIVKGVSRPEQEDKRSAFARTWRVFRLFFALYKVPLTKFAPADFSKLRHEVWHIDEDDFLKSFLPTGESAHQHGLSTMGDMGYSGSTFFLTSDEAYLIKSIPRHFEHSFFREELLEAYLAHMTNYQDSALIRITDLLAATSPALGISLGFAPSHHIIMENILYGQASHQGEGKPKWESWDLKPNSYFFPERDIAGGRLSSEATKSRLADEFPGKIILKQDQADDFFRILENDTKLLASMNTVDYSLFLVRIQVGTGDPFEDPAIVPAESPFTPPGPPSWRTGVVSPDGQHVFRAAILDFFWAKHKVRAKMMTGLINAWNLIDRQGHMSITTTPGEYRERFLKMCKGFVEVKT